MLNASDFLFAPWYRAQARRNVLEADQMMLEAESIMLLLGSRLPPGWRDKFDFVYCHNGEHVIACAEPELAPSERRAQSQLAIKAAFLVRGFATSLRDQVMDLEDRAEIGLMYTSPSGSGEAVPDYEDAGRASLDVAPDGPVPRPPSYACVVAMRPTVRPRTLSLPSGFRA